MAVYYNEFDPFAAAWLRNLIAGGHIATGDVDERSIVDVRGDDLKSYSQCHFFAGIGGWSLALRLAGVDDGEPIWTGSCPCQPFSAAGKRLGTADARHLWPDFLYLIDVCRPTTVFGEQVASKDGREWLANVRADLETLGYAVGAADLCAPGVGAYHIRQRLYWGAGRVADGEGERQDRGQKSAGAARRPVLERGSTNGGLAHDDGNRREGVADAWLPRQKLHDTHGRGAVSGLEYAESNGRDKRRAEPSGRGASGRRGESYWADAEWITCSDGKARPIEPGTFPLAYGLSARVGRLRGYGNAIVPQVAAEFVSAWRECMP